MEIDRYVKFDNRDIIEALQDLYKKRTGNEIDIAFDENNDRALRNIRNITIKITIENKAEIETPRVGVDYIEMEEKASIGLKSTTKYPLLD